MARKRIETRNKTLPGFFHKIFAVIRINQPGNGLLRLSKRGIPHSTRPHFRSFRGSFSEKSWTHGTTTPLRTSNSLFQTRCLSNSDTRLPIAVRPASSSVAENWNWFIRILRLSAPTTISILWSCTLSGRQRIHYSILSHRKP